MSLTKAEVPASAYIKTGIKSVKNGKAATIKIAEQLSTLSLIWLLVKRHKVGLLAVGNIVLLLNWLVPFWFDLVRSMF